MRNLEARVYRKRLTIEGRYTIRLSQKVVKEYMISLARVIGMHLLTKPFIFSPNKRKNPVHHGIAGFVGWVESGCSVYTWDKFNFFTVEIYTCKKFSIPKTIAFTKDFWKCKQIVFE